MKFKRFKLAGIAAAAAMSLSLLISPLSHAADEFDHMVKIVVPFAPGGTSDILARLIAPKLSAAIGQTVIVENKPGAAGNVGADAVAKAPKDGHTLLITDVGSLASAPALFSNLTFDLHKDLAPVGMIMYAPYVLAVHPDVPAKTIQEFMEYSKANPGKIAMANSGVGGGNHITAIVIENEKGVDWKNVPYKGGAAAIRAVIAGESQAIINGTTATLPYVLNGQMVGLAVTGKARMEKAPNLPTFDEAGLPMGDAGTPQAFLTTGGTPEKVVKRLSDEIRKILADPEMQQKIAEQGGEVQSVNPAELKKWLEEKNKFYTEIIKAAGIKAE